MSESININGVDVTVYVDGASLPIRFSKDGIVKLDSILSFLNLAKVVRPENIAAVKALIARVETDAKDAIASAVKAERAEIARNAPATMTRTRA